VRRASRAPPVADAGADADRPIPAPRLAVANTSVSLLTRLHVGRAMMEEVRSTTTSADDAAETTVRRTDRPPTLRQW